MVKYSSPVTGGGSGKRAGKARAGTAANPQAGTVKKIFHKILVSAVHGAVHNK